MFKKNKNIEFCYEEKMNNLNQSIKEQDKLNQESKNEQIKQDFDYCKRQALKELQKANVDISLQTITTLYNVAIIFYQAGMREVQQWES